MKIVKALFAGSSDSLSGRPKERLKEIAFIGRSNVGKSSLINMLCGNRTLAKTSSTPGKTKCVNHFLINDNWYLVDLPGYGYAKMSLTARHKLEQMINSYILTSPELVTLFVLIDSRHEIGRNDLDFLTRLGESQVPFAVIFTKADKLGPKALEDSINSGKRQILEIFEELPPVFVSSSEKKTGKEEILDYIDSILKI
ncbi:MAG: ribosome biogenesis GTP-binding protein YihA/YsxC [Bacteroidales bacterium]|nr:ribosome biogenesis GTP-binding protein YihA/YsxC [Bacteroidales bacterium]